MRRRVPIIAGACLAAAVTGAEPVHAVSGDLDTSPPVRLALACSGTLSADGAESAIESRGTLDLASGRITGFGVGSVDLVLVTARTVGFDSSGYGRSRLAKAGLSDAAPRPPATLTRGTLDRDSGALHIVVVSGRDPSRILMEMAFACRMEPAVF